MKIVCFKYGEALYPESRLFADRTGDNKIPMSFCFYLVLTGDRKILVDTGCEADEHYKMYVYKRPVELLNEYGLTAKDITDVILTHSHLDHVEGIPVYKGIPIYIQKDEVERAEAYLTPEHICKVFEDDIAVCDGVCVKHIGGHSKGSCVVFAGEYILCGDEAYYYRNFKDKVRIGNCYSEDVAQGFVEKYGQGRYTPLVCHDSGIMSGRVGFEEIEK